MNVLLDTNVVLDVLLDREPWVQEAQQIWQACESKRISGYLLASSITDIFYIARRLVGIEKARQAVELCLSTFVICPIDRTILELAIQFQGKDFEDNVQIAAAMIIGIKTIVTRNTADFDTTDVAIVAPQQLMALLAQ